MGASPWNYKHQERAKALRSVCGQERECFHENSELLEARNTLSFELAAKILRSKDLLNFEMTFSFRKVQISALLER
jgi:hypothetical protein